MTRETNLSVDQAATLTGVIIGSELRAGDVLGGRFRIESLIGIGGMGVVYRAFDQSLDIEVALKLLRPELARRPEAFESFRRELLLARQVSSPHVVRIHDIAEDNGRWFISMDFIQGESLEQRLDRSRGLPVEEALAITHGLLDGLAAAHLRGVVHRDLKPANVLLDADGHAYISDFGIARSLGATGLTQTGMIVGTPEYLSPEQARGQNIDGRSDLYTVGLILFEMLVGSLPFTGGTPAETVMQRLLRPPPSLAKERPELPRWLHAFNDRLLAVNPAHRLESAKVALRAMETRRVPRQPLNWRALATAATLAIAVTATALSLWRHPDWVRRLIAPVAAATPRIAFLPLTVSPGDADLAAAARALDAHLHAWLRNDPRLMIVPRRRVLDALQRVAPDASSEAPVSQQLPDVARAAGATRLLSGRLQRDPDGALELNMGEPAEPASKALFALKAANAADLFAAYLREAPATFAAQNWQVLSPPSLAANALLPLGRALLALDTHNAAAATAELSKVASDDDAGALVQEARLDAEEDSHQPIAAQTTRDAIAKRFATSTEPFTRELYARALSGNDQGDDAARVLAAATHDHPHDASLALLDAQTLVANGEGDQAMDRLKRFVAQDEQDPRAWFLLGRTAIQQGQPRVAVDDYLLHALVLYTRGNNAQAEAETRNALGIGYDRLGQPEAAIEQYTRAAATREKLGDQIGLSRTLRNLAVVQAVSGHQDLAEKTLDRAKTILEGIGDRANLADLYNDRGVIAEERGDFDAALKSYRDALALRQQLGEQSLVAESLDNVGFSSYQLGRFDDAQVYWQQALSAYQQLDDRVRMLKVEQNMGLLDLARGHFEAARQRLQETLTKAQASQLSEQVSVSNAHLAELALVEGRYADAVAKADQAVQIAGRRSDRRTETGARLQIVRAGLAMGDAALVDKTLAAIDLGQLGSEQKAAMLLAKAQREALHDDPGKAGAKLDEAGRAAADAHSGSLDLQIRFERVRLALAVHDRAAAVKLLQGVGGDTAQLNEVPLRLQWLELEIAEALGARDKSRAASHYRQAVTLLAGVGIYAHAATIHALGALALAPGAESDVATAAAVSARDRMLAQAPPEAHTSLAEQMDRRLREEAPDDNAH